MLKVTLIVLTIVVAYFLLSARWPNSVATKLLGGFLILCIVLLALARVLEIVLGWSWLLMFMYRAAAGLVQKLRLKRATHRNAGDLGSP